MSNTKESYDDSAISLAKKDRAALNNLKKAINDKKIEIKNLSWECTLYAQSFVQGSLFNVATINAMLCN